MTTGVDGQRRNASVDFAKVAASFAVVWLHVSAAIVVRHDQTPFGEWMTANIADSFVRWAVPIFVMISGSLLLSRPETARIPDFYIKSSRRLGPTIVFWSLFYLGLRFFYLHEDIGSLLQATVAGSPYFHLWYLYMICGLYLVAPFLRVICAQMAKGRVFFLAVGLMVLSAIEVLSDVKPGSFLFGSILFLGYFILGFSLRETDFRKFRLASVIVIIVSGVAVALASMIIVERSGIDAIERIYGYCSPLVVLLSVSAYFLLMSFSPKSRPIQSISEVSLGIYVIHPLWMKAASLAGLSSSGIPAAVGIPLTACVVFVLSALSAVVFGQMPYIRRVVR
jgi:surface polysaccharide O-acyltransferase-like enzyme